MTRLQTELMIAAVALLLLIAFVLKNNRMAVKYSVMWLTLPVMIILMIIFASPIASLSNMLGFDMLSNFIFVIIIGMLLLICFGLTIIVSKQKKEITRLIQEIAIIREKIDGKKE